MYKRQLLLRSIKELEFDRAMGKIGEADFNELSSRMRAKACLLYTSDAADERSSVDLGGRRIIKKKSTTAAGNTGDEVQPSDKSAI